MKPDQPKKWIGYFECVVALTFCLLSSGPNFIKYNITKILMFDEYDNITIPMNCSTAIASDVSEEAVFLYHKIISQTLLRVFPTFMIISLNIFIYRKIKILFKSRQRLFNKNEFELRAQQLSNVKNQHLMVNDSFQENLKRSSSTGDILRKIIKKWYVDIRQAN